MWRPTKWHILTDLATLDGGRGALNPATKHVVPFQLVFPTRALSVNQEHRDRNSKLWAKNRVYIEAPESPFGTRVSFRIVDDTFTIAKWEEPLSYPLAIMPAWPGTKLWVVVSHEYEWEMLRVAGEIIRNFGDIVSEDFAEKTGIGAGRESIYNNGIRADN